MGELGEEEASEGGMSPILTLDLGDRSHWEHYAFSWQSVLAEAWKRTKRREWVSCGSFYVSNYIEAVCLTGCAVHTAVLDTKYAIMQRVYEQWINSCTMIDWFRSVYPHRSIRCPPASWRFNQLRCMPRYQLHCHGAVTENQLRIISAVCSAWLLHPKTTRM